MECYLFSFFLLSLSVCTGNFVDAQSSEGQLIFQSGFEGAVRVIRNGNDSDIIGNDNSLSKPNDWQKDLDDHPQIGNFSIQYQGGDSSMRFARIIPEPGNISNHVLHFWLISQMSPAQKGEYRPTSMATTVLRKYINQ